MPKAGLSTGFSLFVSPFVSVSVSEILKKSSIRRYNDSYVLATFRVQLCLLAHVNLVPRPCEGVNDSMGSTACACTSNHHKILGMRLSYIVFNLRLWAIATNTRQGTVESGSLHLKHPQLWDKRHSSFASNWECFRWSLLFSTVPCRMFVASPQIEVEYEVG